MPLFDGVPETTTLHELGVLSGTFLHVTEDNYEKDNPDDVFCGTFCYVAYMFFSQVSRSYFRLLES